MKTLSPLSPDEKTVNLNVRQENLAKVRSMALVITNKVSKLYLVISQVSQVCCNANVKLNVINCTGYCTFQFLTMKKNVTCDFY